jgi:hypothetical protein
VVDNSVSIGHPQDGGAQNSRGPAPESVSADDIGSRLVTAKAWRRANDVPGKAFGDPTLFANPALNILLDLYISQQEGHAVNVSSACVASGAPATTALRYIARLSQIGLVRKAEDTRDHRVCYLALTPDGVTSMMHALDEAADSDRRLGLGRLGLIK